MTFVQKYTITKTLYADDHSDKTSHLDAAATSKPDQLNPSIGKVALQSLQLQYLKMQTQTFFCLNTKISTITYTYTKIKENKNPHA